METQQVLILQHSEGSPPGTTLQWLEKHQIPYRIHFYAKTPHQQPDLTQFSGLIICGGGMNVDEEHLFPWMRAEKKLIENSLKKEIPVVGLCLGAQMIAEILGAKVGRHTLTESGWQDVLIDSTAHPLLQFSEKNLKAFQWHSYAFETPKSAVRFATNEHTANQGFFYGDKVVATQFHPETTPTWVEQCLADPSYPVAILANEKHCQSSAEVRNHLHYQSALKKWYFSLLDGLFQKK